MNTLFLENDISAQNASFNTVTCDTVITDLSYKYSATKTTVSTADSISYLLQNKQTGFITIVYNGPNKEGIWLFPVALVASSVLNPVIGTAIVSQAYNGVTCTPSISGDSLVFTFSNGVIGAGVTLRYTRL